MVPGGWDLAGPDGKVGTSDDLSLAKCGAGQYDDNWRNLANDLAYYGLHWAYLRLGWEMDGGWYAWRAQQGQGNEASYASCFRRIVQVMRAAQPANQWKFVFNTAGSWWDKSYLDAVWPGDAYVDIVAIDVYDQSWVANTYPYPSLCDDACRLARQQTAWNSAAWFLYAIRDFAAAHGKPMAIPEWGVTTRSDGHGGGDSPYYVQKMHDFIMDPANRVVFHAYFDVNAPDGAHQISGATDFPKSAALFKQLFGTAPTSPNGAPTVSISSPGAGQTVSGTLIYTANAADDAGVSRVDFSIDATALPSDTAAPYGGSLDTTALANGTHTLKAVAYDAQGLSATSQVTIDVQNAAAPPPPTDSTPPTVSLTSPADGTVFGKNTRVTLAASASDNVAVATLEFLVNSKTVCFIQSAPYQCSWTPRGRLAGSYTVTARATDAAGNVAATSATYASGK
jgi:hypothetical protein